MSRTTYPNQNEDGVQFDKAPAHLLWRGGGIGIPSYLLAREPLGNTGAMFFMLAVMLPAFLLAMYEKDGLPFEKVFITSSGPNSCGPGFGTIRQKTFTPRLPGGAL